MNTNVATDRPKQSSAAVGIDAQPARAPFVHRFETPDHKYVFDVNTARILRVSETVWDVIEFAGALPPETIAARCGSRYSLDEARDACQAIARRQQEDNLLLSKRPSRITMPYSDSDLHRMLSTERNQLILNVTEACNFRCTYCIYGGGQTGRRRHSGRMMPWEVARAAIGEFLAASGESETRAISFYGGEPLLNLSLLGKCVARVRTAAGTENVRFSLTTNGSLLTESAGDFLAAERFAVSVSLDGPKHLHDRNRRYADGRPTWETVVGNLRRFLARHPEYKDAGRLGIAIVLAAPVDLRELEQFLQSFDVLRGDVRLRANEANLPEDVGGQCPASQKPRPAGTAEMYKEFVRSLVDGSFPAARHTPSGKLRASLFEHPFLRLHKRKYLSPHLPDQICPISTCVPGMRRVFVTVDGEYYPCERTSESESLRIGSVRDGVNVARAGEMLTAWVASTGEQCAECWCLPICGVGCFASVKRLSPSAGEGKPAACRAFRRRTDRLMKDYCRILERNPRAFDYAADVTFS